MLVVLDFGSQYTQLIARRIREANVYCEIHPYNIAVDKLRRLQPSGIVLSGGPASVYDQDAPHPDPAVLELEVPYLGICYGMGVLAHTSGGKIVRSHHREYGRAQLVSANGSSVDPLFAGISGELGQVWMSHGDRLEQLPEGWRAIAVSENSPFAAIRDEAGRRYGLQFHPEVVHSVNGRRLIENFLFAICHDPRDWTPESFVEATLAKIAEQVGHRQVLCGLSGGVDSSVTAALIEKAVPGQLTCVFVDNGLLRKGESREVCDKLAPLFGADFVHVDASQRFLAALDGVADPEQKRKIIGTTFIEVFDEAAHAAERTKPHAELLAQGTLYPDVIESVSVKGPSATIKSHHNVGGLPEHMKLELVEPLRELFKDEVRAVGKVLGLPHDWLWRHPFPGPGLAVRILGPVNEQDLAILREADAVFLDEIRRAGVYQEIWQAFAVLLPIRTVGVQGDFRTYDRVIALRAITSEDGMTADWYHFAPELLAAASSRIANEVRGVSRVVYDISSKPPATVEWE